VIEFSYTIHEGKIRVDRRAVFAAYVRGLGEGVRGRIRFLKGLGRPKTLPQLGYYWAAVLPPIHKQLVADGHEVMGVPINEDMAHEIVKHFCANVRDGEYVTLADMTKMEAMQFLDNAIRWAAQTLHVIIPEPTHEYEGVI